MRGVCAVQGCGAVRKVCGAGCVESGGCAVRGVQRSSRRSRCCPLGLGAVRNKTGRAV